MEEKNLYKHDCHHCIFLGQFEIPSSRYAGKYDLYFCPQASYLWTLIARFGDYGPDYYSGREFTSSIEPITEAFNRAVKANLISRRMALKTGLFRYYERAMALG